jgi:NadR type nicotinamide-nucleotide adenylyltransferase
MTKRFRSGLVVGKFSPLHRGHELVIQRAFEACLEVSIISYSKPEWHGCEAERRESWLAELFPAARRLVVTDELLRQWFRDSADALVVPPNDADDSAHRQFTALLCRQVLGVTVDAVFTSEDYGDGFAADLTQYFRRHHPAAPAVQHVMVDRARTLVPIGGARIRADVHAHREWLSPAVYASFVRRVCVLGGESSGKSSLAEALASRFETVWVPEYGRELWEVKNGALVFDDMLHIAEWQVAMEQAAAGRANRFLFCDTSPLTTLFYSLSLFGRADPRLEQLATRRYGLVVVCAPDFAFVQDGTRQGTAFREHQHAWYVEQLAGRSISYRLVTGNLENRIVQVSQELSGQT